MPDVGSSKRTILELPNSAIASWSFRFCPPEIEPANAVYLVVRLNYSRVSSITASMFSTFLSLQ